MAVGFSLGHDTLTTAKLTELASQAAPAVALNEASWQRVRDFRSYVERDLHSGRAIYGINTGFGFLSNVRIDDNKLGELQGNLVRSHACGVGQAMPDAVVRGLLVLRAHTFALGHSGVSVELMKVILAFLQHDVLPFVPEKGSVGASGDLAPLAHLATAFLGEGQVRHQGEWRSAGEVCHKLGIKAADLQPKEGLSLINGTHFMATLAAFAVEEAKVLAASADIIAALSLDAIKGTLTAFDARIHGVRPQTGQGQVAENVRRLFIGDDAIMASHADCNKVQDPYSFRCIPQVHGASRDAIAYAAKAVDIELNSVTDNPLCFEDGLLSGGNFHGQPLALAMDFLGIAVAELGSISERRIEKMTNPAMSGLPAFITKDSGLNSGYMIPHVVAAALASENKVLAHPSSVDSIPTSADKEDHVSMGPMAARKAREINRNVAYILAIELLAACQGIDLLAPLKPGRVLNHVLQAVRRISPLMDRDRSLHGDIEALADFIKQGKLVEAVAEAGVSLH